MGGAFIGVLPDRRIPDSVRYQSVIRVEGYMGNLLKTKAAFWATAAIVAASAQAQPTSNSQLLSSAMIEKASAADITGFLEPLNIAVTPFEDGDDEAYTIMATAETGGQFLVTLFGCADPVAGEGCEAVSSYAGFSNAGLAYDDLNRFNTQSNVSKAINVADQNAVIFGVQQYLSGGVSADNMQFVMVLFLTDLDRFMAAQENAQTSISLPANSRETQKSKTGNLLSDSDRPAPAAFGRYSLSGAIASAINNTGNVTFGATPRP